jgi:hypothetical protein
MEVRNATWRAVEKDGETTLYLQGEKKPLATMPTPALRALKAIIEQMERGR